ncbi:neurofilament medium polypeptide isoform X3 [Drosophila sulfurigaster albostrigata]|uniref:neurofilament medium polypeptide isoform X3 n=1 Tax=Drosophila sulfurigaster albostrigata TaxID=89887 RepID=UPI002D21AD93|nr:neurofilament medium polypeptide isoform X3 [Drosophila sulfurigaster albostrigata]
MVIDIKMCRFDNVPWGFRLVGGADYDYPLTVVKVTEGSIAEEAGLCVEDIIVRINDTAATPLTHDEAHRLILGSGSVFYFGVYREHEEELLADGPLRFPVSASSLTKSPSPGRSEMSLSLASLPSLTEATKALMPEEEQQQFETATELEVDAECRRAMTEMHAVEGEGQPEQQEEQEQQEERQSELQPVEVDNLYLPDLPDRPCSVLSEQSEIKLVEEEIAAVLSGESEVLKEHNVLGVNFYRIFPKPGVCMTSDVLRSLNEEVTKTKQEKEKENRKWSTFLQRPDRPVPKSRQQLEAERRAANAYKVKIVKSAPRDKSPMPEAKPEVKTETEAEAETVAKETSPEAAELKAEEQPEEQKEKEEEEEPLPTDSEVPNLEQLPENDNGGEVANAEADGEQLEKADASKEEPQQVREAVEEEAATEVEVKETTPPKTDEELALEKQLSDVQKQLAALSSLPSTIQSTLDAVTKQLAELLPTFKLQQQQQQQLPQIDEGEQQAEAEEEVEKEQKQPDQLAAGENEDSRNVAAPCENNEDKCDANDLEVAEFSHSNGDNRELDEQLSEQQTLKKQKKHNVIEELEEHLVRKNNPKRSKRAFGPLTPSSERPLVLPGGRRWYRPKDAYNDEFIAETLSAQAELITGSTLGVNFMKYQKPERKIDLNRSEVYKVVHHLDRAPLHGIEVRAPLVAAESDIRQALES